MLTDQSIEFTGGNDIVFGVTAIPLAWIIDGDVLYDLPVMGELEEMFTNHDEVLDVTSDYSDLPGMTVRFMKNDKIMDELNTSEYFANILLSEPQVINILLYPYGRYVQSPHAKFDGEKFIITNRDVSNLMPWHPKNPHAPTYDPNFGRNHID